MKAPKIILIHNHPSGDSKPSKNDIEITAKLYDAANMVGVELLDHLVIGNMEYTSIMGELQKNWIINFIICKWKGKVLNEFF